MTWIDTTSYPRGTQGQRPPTEWTLKAGNILVCVHRYLDLPGWFLSCFQLNLDRKKLQAEDLKLAQVEALTFLLDTVRHLEQDLKTAIASQVR